MSEPQLNSLSNSKNLNFNVHEKHMSCSVEARTIIGLFVILCLLYQTPCGAAAKGQAKVPEFYTQLDGKLWRPPSSQFTHI